MLAVPLGLCGFAAFVFGVSGFTFLGKCSGPSLARSLGLALVGFAAFVTAVPGFTFLWKVVRFFGGVFARALSGPLRASQCFSRRSPWGCVGPPRRPRSGFPAARCFRLGVFTCHSQLGVR